MAAGTALQGTMPLVPGGDRSIEMVHAIDRFLDREIAAAEAARPRFWNLDFSDESAYEGSIQPNRERLAQMIGAVDARNPAPKMELIATVSTSALVAETDRFTVHAVRWGAVGEIFGEGLLLRPEGPVAARVVALPDANQLPELISGLHKGLDPDLQFARRLAENGCEVIVPALIDRSHRFSGNPRISRSTDQPHREFLYRQAYIFGRHIIGYEVQKVRAAIDWFLRDGEERLPVGVVGWGEGGLVAFYTAALDTRVEAALVSGYFGNRDGLWREPMYRNVFGLLKEFGDAEIASLIAPRKLIIEYSRVPALEVPEQRYSSLLLAATGRLETPSLDSVLAEVDRAIALTGPIGGFIRLQEAGDSSRPLAEAVLLPFLQSMNAGLARLEPPGKSPERRRGGFDEADRQLGLVREIETHLQRKIILSREDRNAFLWEKVPPTTAEAWAEAMEPYRKKFWNEAIGRFDREDTPLNAQSRRIYDETGWTGYEVVFDALPGVFGWGYYLLPEDLAPGERRPVVVLQHGGGGFPEDAITEDRESRAWRYYKAYGRRLVERGFIVFAQHMLNGGHDNPNFFAGRPNTKILQRKANTIGGTITAISVAQNDALIDWLESRPEVDPTRIAYYGLSYGGKAAMRIPAIINRYALSICSADFNEWIWKNASTEFRASMVWGPNWDSYEWNLGSTFSYAEMAALIAPRPFMVERGHDDGVSIDEWVAWEYARVRRLYAKLGIPERTAIEYFDGPHTINGQETFRFLHRHLDWPEPAAAMDRQETRRDTFLESD